MKTIITNLPVKICFCLLLFLSCIRASAESFWIDGLEYTITSDSTVSLTGNSFEHWHENYGGGPQLTISTNESATMTDNYSSSHGRCSDICIPSVISYNNVYYTVTAIGDSVFYCKEPYYLAGEGTANYCFIITLPKTITSIGYKAFGGYSDFFMITCLASTPPIINDSFEQPITLFVLEENYSSYERINNNNNYFSSIHTTNGEKSHLNRYEEEFYFNPFGRDNPYGCLVKLYFQENSTIYTCQNEYYAISGNYYFGSWQNTTNTNIYEYVNELFFYHGWWIDWLVIDEGKSPSFGSNQYQIYYQKPFTSFDYSNQGIYYNTRNGGAAVTYCTYTSPYGGKHSNVNYESNIIQNNSNYLSGFYDGEDESDSRKYFVFYQGNVIIPSSSQYYTTLPVKYIDDGAFSGGDISEFYNEYYDLDTTIYNEYLHSVTLPETIEHVGQNAFGNSPNLSFIKCLGAIPPSASNDSFDEEVYQNTTLYVPIDAVDAYRNAPGWKNFLNIVGHYSFDYDFVADGIFYAIVDDNVVVTQGEDAYQGVVNIPTNVTYEGVTYNVIGIADNTFTDAALVSLILPVSIENIGEGAFNGCHIGSLVITGDGAWTAGAIDCEVDGLYVMSGVTGIQGLLVNPETTVYSYSTVPPTCDEQTYTGYDAALHVPASALAAYFTAPYWNYFINITSDAVEPTEVTLNNDSVSVLVGNQLTLAATPAPANATPNECIWTSSDDNIATVEDGVITAVHVGECDIKAYLLDKMAVCHVTVTEIAPTEITISPEFAKLEIGSQVTLTATVMPEDATDKTVIWETTNSDVATVDSDGNVTAVGQGECFITATCRDNQATCHIIVVDHFVFITLDEHSVRMMPNHMAILTPSVMPEGTDLVVTSSNPAVAAARMANGKIQVVGITEGRTVIKVNSTDGYAEVDSCLVRVYTLRGDVNSDGFVNIGDVTALIGYVLSGNADGVNLENADANNDGGINIGDVTRLISAILSGEELDPKEEPIEGAETFTVNGVTFTMLPVEGGTFTMGATPEQGTSDPWNDERPTHEVTLSTFMIGQTEVTQALWQAVMGSNPSEFSDNPNRPVEMVSWDDCQAFIAQLNQLTGRNFRLPTEAEWEYAARGGKQSQGYKYAGGDDVNEVAWWDTNAGDGVGPDSPDYGTHQVCTKKANELGLFDMSGNVWEWCQDWYGSYSSDAQTNPTGPATGSNRVYRGGSWFNYARNCRVSSRYHWTMNGANYIGLRLAL